MTNGRGETPSALRKAILEESRRSFLRMISHELRTPLNSIIGFSEIIGRELYGPINEPRYREHAQIINESGLKLLKLVNQFMEIARLEAGAADLDLRPEAVVPAVEEAFQALKAEADSKRVRLHLDAPPLSPPVLADARGLKTILLNLLQNALTHSPTNSNIWVTLRGRGENLWIEIRDEGPGVPAGELARLTNPFEQGEAALTRRSEGAGLGLAIVRLLCRAMDGQLSLAAAPGGGLKACVRLPCAEAPASA